MIKIVNEPCLPYEVIGKAMDHYIEESPEDTLYVGKIDVFNFIYRLKECHVQIRYMKSGIEWRFTEVGDVDDKRNV